MNVLIFGASGMLGHGVLRECLLADDVALVQVIGRSELDTSRLGVDAMHLRKLQQVVQPDLFDYRQIENRLKNFDACFFCLGVSSGGMREADYRLLTYDLTLAAAQVLARLNPQMTFTYVSGASTDSSEQGKSMWARVKGRTENALLRLPFKAAYMFRPGVIQALHGARSRTPLYRIFYVFAAPLMPLARRLMPDQVLTTEVIGRAMLNVARHGADRRLLESPDINRLGSEHPDAPASHARTA
ncbi:epimerase [Herbaspirillum lusitanum]|uniref:Epimerase n=1 Tax=Herbaspirillum lusitanum TaxID=213312 RepID=A0ABW9ACM3_9BURK